MGAAEIRQSRDHHTRVVNHLLERCEIDAWVAGRVMCDGRQRVTIGLRDVLSGFGNPVTATPPWSQKATLVRPEFEAPVATRFEQDLPRLFKNVDRSGSRKPPANPAALIGIDGGVEPPRGDAERSARTTCCTPRLANPSLACYQARLSRAARQARQ